jgi:hypothetical protein
MMVPNQPLETSVYSHPLETPMSAIARVSERLDLASLEVVQHGREQPQKTLSP